MIIINVRCHIKPYFIVVVTLERVSVVYYLDIRITIMRKIQQEGSFCWDLCKSERVIQFLHLNLSHLNVDISARKLLKLVQF